MKNVMIKKYRATDKKLKINIRISNKTNTR